MKKKITEWSPEEKAEIERLFKRWKEMLSIFWTALIPAILGFGIMSDELVSIVVKSNYVPTGGPIPFYPFLSFIGFTFLALVFMVIGGIWKYRSKRLGTLFLMAPALFLVFMGQVIEIPYLESHGLTYWEYFPKAWFIGLSIYFGIFFLSIKANTIKQRMGVVSFLIILFMIVNFGFFQPMFPDFTWVGEVHQGVSTGELFTIIATIAWTIAILIMTVITLSERVRVKLAVHEMKEHRAKRKK